jgi:hypothetical protein
MMTSGTYHSTSWLTLHMLTAVSYELAKILDCGLSKEQLEILLRLLKQGEHPEALAALFNKNRDKDTTPTGPSWEQ